MVCTRRSSKKSEVGVTQKMATPKMKTYLKRKNQKQKQQPSEKHQQLQNQQEKGHLVTPPPPPPPPPEEEHQQQEENHLATPSPPPPPPGGPGHVNEAEVQGMGGGEVMFLDISSSDEETKPQVDHLSRLKSAFKPPSHIKTPQKNLKKLMDAAVVLKDELVSHLEKTTHELDVADMVRSANNCFIGLRSLKVDYGAFHGEVHKLIEYFQELKETKAKNTCTDLGLKVAYEKIVADVDDAREELTSAEHNLINAQTNHNLTVKKMEKLREILGNLKDEEATERDGLENLTAKRDLCNEALSLAETSKERYEEIQRSLRRLRDLV